MARLIFEGWGGGREGVVILKGKDSLIVNSLYNLNIQEHIVYVNETLKLYLWHSSPPSPNYWGNAQSSYV